MHLSFLKVGAFRNLKPVSLELPESLNLFIGKNAQGKTNILESISLLAHTKSFRNSVNQEMTPWGAESYELNALVSTDLGEVELAISGTPQGKRCFVNNEKVSRAGDYLGKLLSQSFVPEDLNLIKGPASVRRKFLDQTICSIDSIYLAAIGSYNKIIKHKNRLLSDGQTRDLGYWNQLLIKEAGLIVKARKGFIEDLAEPYGAFLGTLSEQKEASHLSYTETLQPLSLDTLSARLKEESRRCLSLYGPHRDELEVKLNNKPARKWASQGQSRCCALALVLAAAEVVKKRTKTSPILLLDDIESELDQSRQNKLYELVQSLGCQVFITATDASRMSSLFLSKGQTFTVSSGQISPS